jgi:predicted Zn-dependent protease
MFTESQRGRIMRTTIISLLASLLFLAGCSVNPVTGKHDFMMVSSAQEIEMGKQSYLPMQQSQGGAYDVDPELSRYVQDVGSKVASQSGVELPYEFVVLNNSVPNAWALPGGKIAINRGLLTELGSEAELAAVLGHEAVHAAARHTAKQISRSQIMQVGVAATAIASSSSDYGNLLAGGASTLAQLSLSKYGRSAELESDLYGMQYMSKAGYDPMGAVSLQKTFVRLSEDRQSDWLSGLFASHPPSAERVETNIATAATLPAGGESGRDEYQAAMRKTMSAKPAYEAYDEGRKALAEDKIEEALGLANTALGIFNDEAHFHALRGDARLAADKYSMAITNYDRAISRRDDFFYYHLQRGVAHKELGHADNAATDLNRSIELLPTAPAYFALGGIAEERGDFPVAIGHYKVVAKSGGDYGEAATEALIRLDFPTNPGAYIARGCDADSSGNLIVSVRNDTTAVISGVRVAVSYSDDSGRAVQQQHSIAGQISPGQIASVNTGMGPYTAASGCPVAVVAAHIVN